jgi:hypothetical protein
LHGFAVGDVVAYYGDNFGGEWYLYDGAYIKYGGFTTAGAPNALPPSRAGVVISETTNSFEIIERGNVLVLSLPWSDAVDSYGVSTDTPGAVVSTAPGSDVVGNAPIATLGGQFWVIDTTPVVRVPPHIIKPETRDPTFLTGMLPHYGDGGSTVGSEDGGYRAEFQHGFAGSTILPDGITGDKIGKVVIDSPGYPLAGPGDEDAKIAFVAGFESSAPAVVYAQLVYYGQVRFDASAGVAGKPLYLGAGGVLTLTAGEGRPVAICMAASPEFSGDLSRGDIFFYGAALPPSDGDAKKLQGVPIDETDPTDGQALVYDGTAEQWKPGKVPFNQLEYTLQTSTDFSIPLTSEYLGVGAASPAPNGGFRHTLFPRGDYNAKWLMQREISTTAPTTGQNLAWNGISWAPSAVNATQINGRPILANPPGIGWVLGYNGTSWQAQSSTNAALIKDVIVSSGEPYPTEGDMLVYRSATDRWEYETIGTSLMGEPAPVVTLASGNIPIYDAASGEWRRSIQSGTVGFSQAVIANSGGLASLRIDGGTPTGTSSLVLTAGGHNIQMSADTTGIGTRISMFSTGSRSIIINAGSVPASTEMAVRSVTYLESTGVSRTRYFLCTPPI